MNGWLYLRVAVMLISFFCGGLHAADIEPLADSTLHSVEKAVLEAHKRMSAAAQDPDAEKMFAFILDAGPGTVIQNGVYMKSRHEALEAVKTGLHGVANLERSFDQVRVTVLAADAALVTGNGTTTMTLKDGRMLSGPFAVTEVFVLRNGGWKMLHGHHSVPNRR